MLKRPTTEYDVKIDGVERTIRKEKTKSIDGVPFPSRVLCQRGKQTKERGEKTMVEWGCTHVLVLKKENRGRKSGSKGPEVGIRHDQYRKIREKIQRNGAMRINK